MFVPQEELNRMHPTSAMCWSGLEKKRRRMVVVETEEWIGRVFLEYGTPMMEVPLFKSLGQKMFSSENDWPAAE